MNVPSKLDVYFQNSTQECPIHTLVRGSRSIPPSYLVCCLKIAALLFHKQLFEEEARKILTWQKYRIS